MSTLQQRLNTAVSLANKRLEPKERAQLIHILGSYLTLHQSGKPLMIIQSGERQIDDLAVALLALLGDENDKQLELIYSKAEEYNLELNDDFYADLVKAKLIEDDTLQPQMKNYESVQPPQYPDVSHMTGKKPSQKEHQHQPKGPSVSNRARKGF